MKDKSETKPENRSKKLLQIIPVVLIVMFMFAQQWQIINFYNRIESEEFRQQLAQDVLKQFLIENYGVSSIEELEQKISSQQRYVGNPFTTALYQGQLQAENITGMHWYTYRGGSLLNRTDVLAYPSQPAKFIVENVSGTIIWKDGTNGTVYATGTTPTQATNIINWALGNLTSGRTWKEKVLLKGSFVSNPILIPSYTIMEIDGYLKLADGVNEDNGFLRNSDQVNGNTEIEIRGGIIDGNKAQQTDGDGIRLHKVTNAKIIDVTIKNAKTRGVWIIEGTNVTIENSHIYGVGVYDGIWLRGCRWTTVATNIVHDIGRAGIFTEAENGTVWLRNKIVGNVVYNIGLAEANDGIAMEGDERGLIVAYNHVREGDGTMEAGIKMLGNFLTIKGNIIEGGKWGIRASSGSSVIEGNQIYNTRQDAILLLSNYFNGIIVNNEINTFGTDDLATYTGIRLENNARENIITANSIRGDTTYSIIEEGTADRNQITNNFLSPFSWVKVGSRTVIARNFGEGTSHIQENSGSTTIANNEWIAHGLISTPTAVTLTPRAITYDEVTFNVAVVARNSTHFQVGAYWTNGTAISDDAIVVDWSAEYKP